MSASEQTTGAGAAAVPPPAAAAQAPAASVPSAPEPSPQRSIESLNAAERQEWRKTGKVPAAAPPPENEDAPALDAQGKAVVDAQGKTISKRQARINDQISKAVGDAVSTKDAEIARLRSELAQRTPPAQPAAAAPPPAQPAAQPTGPKVYTGLEKEPELKDFKVEDYSSDEDPYGARLAAFTRAHHQWTTANQAVLTGARQSAEKVFNTYIEREKAFKSNVPDFDNKTLAVRQQLNMTSPLSRAVVTSEVGPQLILHFADHPDDFARIGQLGMTDLPAALLALGRLAAKFDGTITTPTPPPSVPAASAPAEQVAPKTESSAPPPNPTLGTRSAESTQDEATAAFVRGDFAAGRRARNLQLAQERAGMR